jgi:hypothetical protein
MSYSSSLKESRLFPHTSRERCSLEVTANQQTPIFWQNKDNLLFNNSHRQTGNRKSKSRVAVMGMEMSLQGTRSQPELEQVVLLV